MNVLVVDDDGGTRQLLRRLLARELAHVQVLEAADGLAALKQLLSERIHVVLLDLTMKGMSGLQTLEAIRRSPTYAALPVVVLSGQADEARVVRARQLGVTAFIAKPFTLSVLRTRLFPMLQQTSDGASTLDSSGPLDLRAGDRVLIVDQHEEFRSFFRERLSPICGVDEAEAELSALSQCLELQPRAVFVGAVVDGFDVERFKVNVKRVVPHYDVRVLALVPSDDLDSATAATAYDDAAVRSFVAGVFDASLQRTLSHATQARMLFSPESPCVEKFFETARETLQPLLGEPIALESVQALVEGDARSVWAAVEVQCAELAWELRLRYPFAAALQVSGAWLGLDTDQISDDRTLEVGTALATTLAEALSAHVRERGLESRIGRPRVALARGSPLWPFESDRVGAGRWVATARHRPALVIQIVALAGRGA